VGILYSSVFRRLLYLKMMDFLEIWDCESLFVQFYLIPTEILSVINSLESGFERILPSDAVIWFQIYRRSDLKRGSISPVARQIGLNLLIIIYAGCR
jgi:hypothetical protein